MWEYELLNWVNDHLHGSPFINKFMTWFTLLGEMGVFWFICGIVFLFFKKYRVLGIQVIVAMIFIAGFNNYIFKPLIARQRPYLAAGEISLYNFVVNTLEPFHIFGIEIGEPPTSYSFMSGHSLSGTLAGTIIFLENKRKFWPFLLIGILLGLSRIFLLVHFPTDVIVGFAFGALMAVLVKYISKLIVRKYQKQPA